MRELLHDAVDALAGHAGVVVCRSVEEVAATALVLTEQPYPAGPRVAVVTNAGGAGVLRDATKSVRRDP